MRGLLLCLLPLAAMAQNAAVPEASLLIRKAGKVLSQHGSFRRQSITTTEIRGGLVKGNAVSSSEVPVSVLLQRPDLLRIESGSPGARMITVSDGSHSWMYYEPSAQYIQRSAGVSLPGLLKSAGFMEQLPNFAAALKSSVVSGDETLVVQGRKFPCWVVVKRYGVIEVPAQDMTLREATETLWIEKSQDVELKNVIQAKVTLAPDSSQAEIVQTTRTLSFELDAKLPPASFQFVPPAGARQIADWSLPGVSRPDVIGKPAPPLRADAIGGGHVDLAALHGRVVLLDFWATWCMSCRQQLPVLEKLQKELGGSGVSIVGVTIGEEPAVVAAFLKKTGLTYANVALDEKDAFAQRFAVSGFPTTVLLDRDGTVVSYDVGQESEATFRAKIRQLTSGSSAASN